MMKHVTQAVIALLILIAPSIHAETMQGGTYTLNGSVDVMANQGQGGTFTLSPNGDPMSANGSGGTYVLLPTPYSQTTTSPTPTQQVINAVVGSVVFGQEDAYITAPNATQTRPVVNPTNPNTYYPPTTQNPPRNTNTNSPTMPDDTEYPDWDMNTGTVGTTTAPSSGYTYPSNMAGPATGENINNMPATTTEADAGMSSGLVFSLFFILLVAIIALIVRWVKNKAAVPPAPTPMV